MNRRISLILRCLAVLPELALASTPAHSAPADSLVGWWSNRLDFGPSVKGELVIERRGNFWRARIAGTQVSVPLTGDSVTFALPKGRGSFRGMVGTNRKTIDGFWIQPAGSDAETPGAGIYNQMYATPVSLERRGSSATEWRGMVAPLDETFTLHLQIYRSPLGNRIASFRNPETNSNGGFTQFHARTQRDSVVFVIRPDSLEPEIRINASINRSLDRLRVFWPDLNRIIEMNRSDTPPAGALPRVAGDTNYVYRRPIERSDGWSTANARDAGMDEAQLAKLINRLVRSNPSSGRPTLMHSILVARRGKLVLEEYFFGFGRDQVHDSRSAGKTFGAVLLGATMLQGARVSPDTKITTLLAERGPFANPDPRKDAITLAHLMTHSAGLACDDNDDQSPGNEETLQTQRAQPDWWKYTLDLPMAYEPGTHFAYGSANSNLVGAALTTGTRTWLPALFERTIARPLEFGTWHWNLIPNGEGYLGGGARLRPRDFLKIGEMYLDGGMWKGKRIVDSSWVRISTASHMEISPATTGMDSVAFGNNYVLGADGYLWHLGELQAQNRTYHAYMASGNGGQLLVVVPDLELVVVFTGGNYRQGGIWLRWVSQIIPQEIIPAIRD
jgi:CubicO group peptidase (beta-lactamase class C family)